MTNGFQHVTNPSETVPAPEKCCSNAPITGLMAYDVYRRRGDAAFMWDLTPRLQRWMDWWFTPERDMDGDGLCDFVGNMESSLDNSLRTDSGRVTAIELNAYLYGTLRLLSEQWRLHGEEKRAMACDVRADRLKAQINARCWNEETGFYFDLADGRQTRIKTSGAFQLLATDIPDARQVARLVEHILNPDEFWTMAPISGVSRDDLPDDPNGYPGWDFYNMFNMTWFSLSGLWRWGYQALAAKITWRLWRLIFWTDEPLAPGDFNGRTGLVESCSPDATFSVSLADFFLRYIAGLHPDAVAGEIQVAPWLGEIGKLNLTHIPYRDGSFSVAMRKEQGGLRMQVHNDSARPFNLRADPAWCEQPPSLRLVKPGESVELFLAGNDDVLLHDNWSPPWE